METTKALRWTFRKRAFSVSGSFRKKLSDLIRYLHNSNKKLVQVTLFGEKIPEERYYLICFVSAHVIKVKNNLWFTQLTSEQIGYLYEYISIRSVN